MQETNNYGFKKRELTDVADITATEGNWDTVDEELKERDTRVGLLANLITTVKTSIVNAINSLKQDVETHLSEKATPEKLGHIKPGFGVEVNEEGVLSLTVDRFDIYFEGEEYIEIVEGYSDGKDNDDRSKEDDHLYLEAWGGAPRSGMAYETTRKVDLSGINLLKTYFWGDSHDQVGACAILQVADESGTNRGDSVAARETITGLDNDYYGHNLDVSALNGEYYIVVMAVTADSATYRWTKTKYYKVWGEK